MTTVTLQVVISGIQSSAYRVPAGGIAGARCCSSWSNGLGARFYSVGSGFGWISPERLRPRRGSLHPIPQDPLLRVEGLRKAFRSGEAELVLFENLSFQVNKGEMLAVVGQSGAGKSTLLHIVGALDRPSGGAVYCADSNVNALSDDAAAEFRNREIGFVWQFHYLLPEFTALENVAMPLLTRGQALDGSNERSFRLAAAGGTGRARASPLGGAFRRRTAAIGAGAGAHHPAATSTGG